MTAPTRSGPRVPGPADAGSVLLESLTGLGLLAVLTVSLATFHASSVPAVALAGARVEALRDADRAIEVRMTALAGGDDDASADHDAVEVDVVRLTIPGDACAEHEAGQLTAVRVRAPVMPAGRSPGEHVALPASLAAPGAGGAAAGSAAVLVVLPTAAATGSVTIAPMADPATSPVATTSSPTGPTCLAAPVHAAGSYELRVHDGPPTLVDRLHRSVAAAPLPVATLGGTLRRDWDIVTAAVLTVEADVSGARPPDRVEPGALAWLVRGDDARVAAPLGGARPVRPGVVTVVVSACTNPESPASTQTVDVVAGSEGSVRVPLATVTVRNVGAHPDATLWLVRSTGCRDGSGLLPSLAWDGGLTEGMRIALPHGGWEAQLRTAAGTRISGPVLVAADGTAVEVVMP
jgi:hypothetical protein